MFDREERKIMPNHVKNMVKVKKLKSREEINTVLNLIARPLEPDDPLFNPAKPDYNWAIDFNKIVPQPEEESECPEDCKVDEHSHIELDKARPWFNWYKWNCDHWGTKWGAYDGYTIIGANYIKFIFDTAWAFAWPVIQKLSLLGYDIEVKYAEEDLGTNCGKLTYDSIARVWEIQRCGRVTRPSKICKKTVG